MKVLITGGAGFIGTNLSKKLLNQGNEVIAVDNLITGNPKNLSYLSGYPKFTFIKHDIVKSLPDSLKKFQIDRVYHLACPTGVPNLKTMAEEMLLTCSVGTRNVLELAKKEKASLLFTSSSEVYGDPKVSPQAENYTGNVDPLGERSPYEEGKRFAESLVRMYVVKYKINAKIVRIFNTYGPFISDSDTRVIPQFLRQAQEGLPLSVHGKGTQKRTFCYVDDLLDGLILVMDKGLRGEVYNLGSDRQITIQELAQKIIALTGLKTGIRYIRRSKHDHESRLPDLTKIKKLGWRLKVDLEEGLLRTIRWMKSVRLDDR